MTSSKENNLGTFSTIEEVWEAYPNGGIEGDILYVGGEKYSWNHYDGIWENSKTFTESTDVENVNVYDDYTFNSNVKVVGKLYADVRQPNCGLFKSLSELKKYHPSPVVGQWACIGNTLPAPVYRCETPGVWTATGESGGLQSDYEKIEQLDSNVRELRDSEIIQNRTIKEQKERITRLEISLNDIIQRYNVFESSVIKKDGANEQRFANIEESTNCYFISRVKPSSSPLIKYPELLSFSESTSQEQFAEVFAIYPFSTIFDMASNGKKRILAVADNFYYSQGSGHIATQKDFIELHVVEAVSDNRYPESPRKSVTFRFEQNGSSISLSIAKVGNTYSAIRIINESVKAATFNLLKDNHEEHQQNY